MKPSYEHFRLKADEELQNYDFGAEVNVEAINGWNSDSLLQDLICTIFIKYETTKFEEDSLSAQFVVTFDALGNVIEVSCTCDGEIVGQPVNYQVSSV